MILSQLISRVKTWVLENYWTLMTDDSQIVFTINNMMKYIYSYRVRKWALVREEVTSETNVYELNKRAVHVIKIVDWDIEYKPTPMPFWLTDSGIDNSNVFFASWKNITLSDKGKTLVVRYLKSPDEISLTNIAWTIDLPEEYTGILYFLCMWNLYPYNLENGASLANNFKTAFVDDMLKVFEKTHSLWLTIESVQWSSAFNWK